MGSRRPSRDTTRPFQRLDERGAQVVVSGRDQKRLDDSLAALGPAASAVRTDVASSTDMNAVFAHVAERHGHLDSLVANAAAPLGRIAQPRHVATVAAFLASDDARFIHGIEIFVDGGLSQV